MRRPTRRHWFHAEDAEDAEEQNSKSMTLRYSATSAREILVPLHEIACQQYKEELLTIIRRMQREVSSCRLLIRCNLKMNTDYGLFHLSLATKSMRERSERRLTTDERNNESRLAETDFSLLSRRAFVSGASQGCPPKSRTSLQMAIDLVLPPLVKS